MKYYKCEVWGNHLYFARDKEQHYIGKFTILSSGYYFKTGNKRRNGVRVCCKSTPAYGMVNCKLRVDVTYGYYVEPYKFQGDRMISQKQVEVLLEIAYTS